MAHHLATATFQRLVTNITALVNRTRALMVRNYWQIGRWIVEAEQDGHVRAAYGAGLLKHVSAVLTKKCGPGFSDTNLRNMRNFYVKHKIHQPADKLTWSQCVALLPIDDERRLRQLEKDAAREHLSRRKLRAVISQTQDETFVPSTGAVLRRPTDLRLGTFQRAAAGCVDVGDGEEGVDCGFGIYRAVKKSALAGVTLTTKPAYTYTARVERVIDGDTVWVFIAVGFGTTIREKLRLAGIDAPELPTPEGKRAKAFVEKRLPKGSTILIKTSTSDKYDRYLADVVYCGARAASGVVRTAQNAQPVTHDAYLNQALLDAGLARVWEEQRDRSS